MAGALLEQKKPEAEEEQVVESPVIQVQSLLKSPEKENGLVTLIGETKKHKKGRHLKVKETSIDVAELEKTPESD